MKVTKWEFIGVIVIALLGIFLFYAYELSNYHHIVRFIAPVRDTLWEFLKMAFYGMLVFALIEYIFIGKEHKNFIFAKAFSSILACFLVASLYYGYTNFIEHNLYLDIIIFIVGILIAQLFSYAILRSRMYITGINYIGLLAIFAAVLFFCSYTINPPLENIFLEIIPVR